MYTWYTATQYHALKSRGFRYLAIGGQLTSLQVGIPNDAALANYEVIPFTDEPIEYNVYYHIDDPDAADLCGGINSIYF